MGTLVRIMPSQDSECDQVRNQSLRPDEARTELQKPLVPRAGPLRDMAIRCDHERGVARVFGNIWQRLRAGDLSVVDGFSTEDRSYLVLAQRASHAARVAPRHWNILERVLLGQSQKVIAIDLDVAVSTVAGSAKTALRALGVKTRVSNVPPLLCMLVHASLKQHPVDSIRATHLESGGTEYHVLSIALKNSLLIERLSPAEQIVVLMRIEGRSLADIATCRRTSRHTVANQLGAAFRRLGLSGRSSLVEYFLQHEATAASRSSVSYPPHAQVRDA